MSEHRTLTRENFHEVGEWAGAFECWGLDAPMPELRIGEPGDFVRAHLGDTIVKSPSALVRTGGASMKWGARRDWAGWSIGWYPTEDDDRMFVLQKINWWCVNLDIGETRISWLHRDYNDSAFHPGPPEPRRRGLGRLVIDR